MEEKNRIIKEYIEDKVAELEEESMFVPRENVDKLLNVFMNRAEEIDVMKIKIDQIFNASVETYKANLEKMGFTYEEIMNVYRKIEKMNKTTAKLYLAGGIVPYALLNETKGRKHSNLDLLCSKDDISIVRELFRKKDLYEPKRDSLTYTINNIDYGFQVVIDKIKVNISVFEVKQDGIIEYNFDCKKRIGRIKNIAAKLNDYIVPYVSADNKKYMTLSLEFIIANKLLSNREKDRKDIEKIQ